MHPSVPWVVCVLLLGLACGILLIPQYLAASQIMMSFSTDTQEQQLSTFLPDFWKATTGTTTSTAPTDNNNPPSPHEDENLPQPPLNILILYPDDWRHDDVGDANPALYTPTFSALAAQGIRFTHNAVTTSICWISRATLFTGQYVSSHRSTYLFRPFFASRPAQWAESWPVWLQKHAGYWVGHIGKWHYNDADDYKRRYFNFSSYFEGWIVRGNAADGTQKFNADLAGSEAIRFLRERPKDRPFAATVAFYPPKGISNPGHAKAKYTAMYSNKTFEEAYDPDMAYQRLMPHLQHNRTYARSRYLPRYETHGNYQNATVAQYATITHIDAVCGEIIAELKRQGVYNNTMIILTADNGEFRGRHAFSDKWYPYQEAIRVPLIIRDPRMSRREPIPPSVALVRKDYKYIDWWYHGKEELFDLQADPYELNNLAAKPELAALKQEMHHRLHTLRHEVFGKDFIPQTRCDPIARAGQDLSKEPNCSKHFPDRCCPTTTS
eukprot:scaffold3484_cov184-Amphora_coffeaeformis.AAC.6